MMNKLFFLYNLLLVVWLKPGYITQHDVLDALDYSAAPFEINEAQEDAFNTWCAEHHLLPHTILWRFKIQEGWHLSAVNQFSLIEYNAAKNSNIVTTFKPKQPLVPALVFYQSDINTLPYSFFGIMTSQQMKWLKKHCVRIYACSDTTQSVWVPKELFDITSANQ